MKPASKPSSRHHPRALVYATGPGGATQDGSSLGGNPFATAFIELGRRCTLPLPRWLVALRRMTCLHSKGRQRPEWEALARDAVAAGWQLPRPLGSAGPSRCALVLVVSRYPDQPEPLLWGAAHDERRVAAALAAQGFSVTLGVAPQRRALLAALRAFAAQSQRHDEALLYATGHGLLHGGVTHLLPGDYPFERNADAAALRRHALGVPRLAAACRARRFNLALFAGCRTEAVPA